MQSIDSEKPVILFDGICNLCTWSVQFIIRRDPKAYFRFASLQTVTEQKLSKNCRGSQESFDSVVLLDKGRCYTESDAALRITRHLSGLWPLLSILIIIPRPLRDGVYRFIARNRYRWFGKATTCMLPRPEIRHRFITEK